MILTNKEIEDFKGWYISDCVVRNRNFFHFSTRNIKESTEADVLSEHSVSKREYGIYLNKVENDRISHRTFTGYAQLCIGATLNKQWNEVVCIDMEGSVYARGNGHNGREIDIPKSVEGPRRGIITRIRMILGRLYAVGSWNTVCYRVEPDHWQSLCLNLATPEGKKRVNSDDYDIEDIDGFTFDDLYVVGDRGNLWHFNGHEWERLTLPSNMRTETICCAHDGYVYIGAQSGTIFKGRGHHWKMIHRGNLSLQFKDIVTHANQIWCTSDYGLWTIKNDEVIKVELPAEINVCAGNLSVADGVMLMAGMFGAAYHDGQDWHLIFNSLELQDPEDI